MSSKETAKMFAGTKTQGIFPAAVIISGPRRAAASGLCAPWWPLSERAGHGRGLERALPGRVGTRRREGETGSGGDQTEMCGCHAAVFPVPRCHTGSPALVRSPFYQRQTEGEWLDGKALSCGHLTLP